MSVDLSHMQQQRQVWWIIWTADSDEHNYCSHSSTAQMDVAHTHGFCLLMMLMGGSVVTSCSLHVLLSPVVYVLGCVLVKEGYKNRQFTGTYVQNRPYTEKPGKSSYPLPPEKNFESTPRELQSSDRAQTSTTGSGRPSSVDVLSVLAKIARTNTYTVALTMKTASF